MRAVVQQVLQDWLDERAHLDLDRHDEMWEGVLHMVPAPGYQPQRPGGKVYAFLATSLGRRGIQVLYETAVHRPGSGGKDYLIPDMVLFRERPDRGPARPLGD
jgi:hypothetical protein